MKKQYLLVVFILIIIYLLFLILNYKYKDYKINAHISFLENIITTKKENIANNLEKLEYINTKAYKNKVLKEEQSMKNKGEIVIFITNEDKFNKYTKTTDEIETTKVENTDTIEKNMTNGEKWIYFLFNKDIR